MDYPEIPSGFGMVLALRPEAMRKFTSLNLNQQQEIINGTHNINSKREMKKYVDDMMCAY